MKASIIAQVGAALTASAGLAAAAPVPVSPNASHPSYLFPRAPRGYCGDSTFENTTNGNSAYANDCVAMRDLLLSRDEQWAISSVQRTLAWAASCAFGAQIYSALPPQAWIGGRDLADIIAVSLQRFGGGGRLGAKGEMDCQDRVTLGGGDIYTTWGLYVPPWYRFAGRLADGEEPPAPVGGVTEEEPPAGFVLHEESGVWLAPEIAHIYID
ncbi:putative necrosis-inducing factor-domain-containing protein [Colletotrichum cereale]|nr:putative necrosis-inducing factor-domain-containing protein [Colletotrichum cereale]